ncbi:MAG: hypothetical protein COS08_02815 [Euryarchaeota archaeon CG01_land_8_20_14_3_00_38_12]|jgi:hypothetical protein|nr:MAG: hypothetical protein COS08_02815 [Euryarchaeota archaeon CG01_land_8_20_14_3_00_38_12]PJB21912.1 MAG: hypothetical protein CO114_02840 [Euryarchaeota archaeon CG_4_9_14_3_um_filter_38_12]
MVEIEDIKMKKPFDDNTFIIIEGKMVEGRPGLSAQLFMPPDRYEYLGMIPLLGKTLTEKELEGFLGEIEKAAKNALEKNRLELFLVKKGFRRS